MSLDEPKIVPLDSVEGARLLQEVKTNNWPYQEWLHLLFAKQIGRSNCGIQTNAMVMSAGALGAKVPCCPGTLEGLQVPFLEKDMFNYSATTSVATMEQV